MPRKTLLEQLTQGLGEAITDIREKVVEEPMWGRALTNNHQQDQQLVPGWPTAPESRDHEQEHNKERDREPDL